MSDQIDQMVAEEEKKKAELQEWWWPEKGRVSPKILERRRQVAICWNQMGMTCADTAQHLGVAVSTIAKDRHWLISCWQKAVEADLVEIVARELAKLERQEAELWLAWERSKEDIEDQTVDTHMNSDGERVGGTSVKTHRRGRLPEAKYMELILRCEERRSKLLGLDKAVTFEGASFSFAMFVEESYRAASEQQQQLKDVTPPVEIPDALEQESS